MQMYSNVEGNNSRGTQNPVCTKGRPRQQRGCLSCGLIYSLIGTSQINKTREQLGRTRDHRKPGHRSFASMEGHFYFLLLLAVSSCVCFSLASQSPSVLEANVLRNLLLRSSTDSTTMAGQPKHLRRNKLQMEAADAFCSSTADWSTAKKATPPVPALICRAYHHAQAPAGACKTFCPLCPLCPL